MKQRLLLESNVSLYSNDMIIGLFTATIQATEEEIINALVAGKTMNGINNKFVPGLPYEVALPI